MSTKCEELKLSVRLWRKEDIDLVIDYFLSSSDAYMKQLGALPDKLPSREEWKQFLRKEINLPYQKASYFYIIWEIDAIPVGHSNLNDIKYEEEAFMHLHIWNEEHRQKGLGQKFLFKTIPIFFDKFALKRIYCQPYSLNNAPNRTLPKLGFKLIETFETTPGPINHYQEVNKYLLSKESHMKMI